jgi:hypothetical protein
MTGYSKVQRHTLFKTGALNHSATLPLQRYQSLTDRNINNKGEQK